jgi:CRP-like cAMP-binding protein
MFASVSVDELFRLAGAGRQSRHEAGEVLSEGRAVPEGLRVLLDGRAESIEPDGTSHRIVAPATIAFEDFLQNRPAAGEVRAADIAVVLLIGGEELRMLLSDSTDLVEGLFRTLAAVGTTMPQRLPAGERFDALARVESPPLSPLDTTFILHQLPVFSTVSAEEALQLAAIARDDVAEPGDVVSSETAPPAVCIVLSGEMALEAPDGSDAPIVLYGGDVFGLHQALAGVPIGRRQRAVRRTRALRIEREDLFDLLERRPALLQQLLGALLDARAGSDLQRAQAATV